jgi:hypothetical protein
MVEILDPREGESVYDPTCGTGGMVLEAIHQMKQTRGDVRTLWGKLYGQEKNLATSTGITPHCQEDRAPGHDREPGQAGPTQVLVQGEFHRGIQVGMKKIADFPEDP